MSLQDIHPESEAQFGLAYELFLGFFYPRCISKHLTKQFEMREMAPERFITRQLHTSPILEINPLYRRILKTLDEPSGKPDILMVDVGAHIGTWCLAFDKLARQSGFNLRGHAIEPGYVFSFLEANLKINGAAPAIRAHEAAASDVDGPILLEFMASRPMGAATNRAYQSGPKKEEYLSRIVDAVTLDTLLPKAEADGSQALVMKIDVQGYEGSVLRGAANFLKRYRGRTFLLMEFLAWSYKAYADFWEGFLKDYAVLRVDGPTIEVAGHLKEIAEELQSSEKPWTDILLVSPAYKERLVGQKIERPPRRAKEPEDETAQRFI